jgi:hypothetical protein
MDAKEQLMSTGPSVSADLIADQGQAASGEDFFRCPSFLSVEGVTHSLMLTDESQLLAAAPVIVRPVPTLHGLSDLTSPYGYPGFSMAVPVAVETGRVVWPTDVVSVFIRERLDVSPLKDSRVRSFVHVSDPDYPMQIRAEHRTAIHRNERAGFETSVNPGPSTGTVARSAFRDVYIQTMNRVEASPRYHFSLDYLNGVLESPASYLVSCAAPDGTIAASAIAVMSDGWLHYFLGGTADAQLRAGPFKNVVMTMLTMARARGMPLNLGGGMTSGDGLDRFKRGFGNRTAAFRTSEVVAAPAEYAKLVSGREADDYFPAYRAPQGVG